MDQPEAARFSQDRARMFDLRNTQRLAELFTVARERRDAAWQAAFFDAAWTGSVVLSDPPTFNAIDGFTYLRLNLPRPAQPFDSQCLANLALVCVRRIDGAAFFQSPDDPVANAQHVLPMGVLDSLLRFDSWQGDPTDVREAAEPATPQASRSILTGVPAGSLLPPYAARGLHFHLTAGWKIENPRVLLLIDPASRPTRILVVSRKLSEFPSGANWQAQLHMLSWYLTPGRAIALMPETMTLEQMTPLTALFGEKA